MFAKRFFEAYWPDRGVCDGESILLPRKTVGLIVSGTCKRYLMCCEFQGRKWFGFVWPEELTRVA